MQPDIQLRDVIETDLPIFYEHQRDPEAAAMAGFASRERVAFLAHWHKILVDPNNVLRTILYDGQVAGNIVSYVMEGEREVGYWIGREFWGRGIATRALAAFLAVILERPLFARAVRHNAGSLRVLQKCGFVLTGEDGDEFVLVLR